MFCLFAVLMASNTSFVAKLNAWKKAVKNSRHVTGSLRDELYLSSDLYDKLALCSLELYKFDFGNDEEIVFQAGEILSGSDWSKGNVEETDLRSNLKADVLATQGQIDDILTKRMELLACEVSSLKRKLKGNKRTKKKKPRDLTFLDRNMMEVRLVAKKLENFSRRRHEIYKTQLTYGIKLFREELEEEEIRLEETRKRSNLHNFTFLNVEDTYGSILSKSGGFVPMQGVSESPLRLVKKFKCHAETALLKYVCSVTGQRFKSLGEKGSIGSLRAKIRYNLSHPRLGRHERDYVYATLELIDRFVLKNRRQEKIKDTSCGNGGRDKLLLYNLGKFLDGLPVILRESDKKMGWSLNSLNWYRDEYRRQLSSSSYRWVGRLEISERLKVDCRNELKAMVGKYRDILSDSDYDWFNLKGNKVYNMPSLNLLPKVHKLSDEASSVNEKLLRGRPIVTGHSWCLIEPSKFIQKELRSVILLFRQYLREKCTRDSILCSSSELVKILKKKYFVFWSGSTFVTFDFKDLYTNILFEDASRTLKHLVKLLKLDRKRILFILELYKFCNRWNYFNVGGDIFKQEEGLSMGCYFSKEISDLVLMYSEYQYSLISIGKGVRLLKRYADDGILIFASQDYNSIVKEIKRLMLFYPSNLIINVKLNRVYCQYLDLSLSLDDVTAARNRVHHRTFFKRFHKFAYLDPWSNHPKHVFETCRLIGLLLICTNRLIPIPPSPQ